MDSIFGRKSVSKSPTVNSSEIYLPKIDKNRKNTSRISRNQNVIPRYHLNKFQLKSFTPRPLIRNSNNNDIIDTFFENQ